MADVAIDLHLPGSTNIAAPLTMHTGAFQTNYARSGNHVGALLPSWRPRQLVRPSRLEV
jgi:hypothetical protein